MEHFASRGDLDFSSLNLERLNSDTAYTDEFLSYYCWDDAIDKPYAAIEHCDSFEISDQDQLNEAIALRSSLGNIDDIRSLYAYLQTDHSFGC